jgi:hypothetical protein
MTNKHPHAEMIKAKADNMGLVVFYNRNISTLWNELLETGEVILLKDYQYFLCLPQHKDECLHWLNGGKIQYQTELVAEFKDYQPEIRFGVGSIFMQSDFDIRIKPRKEKRWVAIRKSDLLVNEYTFESRGEAIADLNPIYWEFYELEIEIEA